MVSKFPKIRLSNPQNTINLPLRANGTKRPEMIRMINQNEYLSKVHIFWEGHKNLTKSLS